MERKQEKAASEQAACDNGPFVGNSRKNYDWGTRTPVRSTCDAWLGTRG